MIIPLFIECFLVLLVGMVDTFMVSYAGETAVSGVSLVNSLNTVFINLFQALASGGAVVVSQYIGKGDRDKGSEASSQLLMFSTLFSLLLMAGVLAGGRPMLNVLYGAMEPAVMDACVIYLWITTLSYPFMAIYNAGSSVLRSMGRTKETMYISILANIINLVGNYIGIFIMHAGVAGVAWPTTISRIFQAVVITIICWHKENEVHYVLKNIFEWNGDLLKKIFNIAVPNGVENAIFNMVKVALSSVVAGFGTVQTTAHGVAQTIWGISNVSSQAMGPVFVTVIGQYMGAGETGKAEHAFWKLLKLTTLISILWNAVMIFSTPFLMNYYQISAQAKQYVILIVAIHDVFNAFFMPFSGPLGNGLRAAGDVRFTMIWAIVASVGGRLALTYILACGFGMGVIGVTIAMVSDWVIRGIIYTVRLKGGIWKTKKVI